MFPINKNQLGYFSVLKKVNQAILKFLMPLFPRETYETIIHEGLKIVDGKDGFIVLKNKRSFYKVYSSSQAIDKVPIRPKGFVYTSLFKNKVFTITQNDFKKTHPKAIEQGIVSSILIPLSYQGTTIGAILLRSKKKLKFSKEELELLKLFGSMASLAIRKTQLYDETRQALETRDLFIALASHELRTPLTSATIYAQLLKKRLCNQSSSETKWADNLAFEIQRLSSLTEELLQIDQIKTGEFKYLWHEVSLDEIITQAINNMTFVHPHHEVIFTNKTKSPTNYITGDKNKLLQVFINTLSNAAKFSLQESPIYLTLSKEKKSYIIQITNNGKGIPKGELEKIFDRFYKGTNNYHEGMGLGLYLTKKIVEDHKGSIFITSDIGKQTIVEIHFPSKK